jgi:hypothetical protein
MNFDIKAVLKESKCAVLPGIQTGLGQRALQKGLTLWSEDRATLERRAKNVLLLRNYLEKTPETLSALQATFQKVGECESIFEADQNEWKNKTSEQIFFETGGAGECVNQLPGLIGLFVFLKIWVAPALAVATPFLMFLLPYFMLKFVYGITIPWEDYQKMVFKMFLGSVELNVNSLGKIIYFIVSLSQTIIQPFLTSIAVQKLDTLVRERSTQISICYEAIENIFEVFRSAKIDTPNIPGTAGSSYATFAKDKDERWTTEYLGQLLGDSEVLFALAINKQFHRPTWLNETSEINLELEGFHDISIMDGAQKSSVRFLTKNSHSLLTGPNRGGKSSNLRGIIQNILWAQTYGLAPCAAYKGKLFSWIISSLRVEDRPGTSSLFEREIEIATEILRKASSNSGKRGIVLIDEIFHSTNPPDGEKSARIFLTQLWQNKNVLSCVSTHVYKIVEESPNEIQKLCCFAEEDISNEQIHYYYTLQPGICKVSSVNDVLREKGLMLRSNLEN